MAQKAAKTPTPHSGGEAPKANEFGYNRTVLRPYRVYGNESRKIKVPEHLVTDPEDAQVRFYSWWEDDSDSFVGLWGTFTDTNCPSGSLPAGIRKKERGLRSVCGPKDDRRTTIPRDCVDSLFPIKSEPMFVSIHYKGKPAGFRLIPESHWTQMLLRTPQPARP
jgi:hypothetical protein